MLLNPALEQHLNISVMVSVGLSSPNGSSGRLQRWEMGQKNSNSVSYGQKIAGVKQLTQSNR